MIELKVNDLKPMDTINPEIYGHFSEHLGRCIYEGLYVGEDSDIPNIKGMRKDVVEALKEMKIPVLRWPGGCFADEYHWMDGIGKKGSRKKMINTHWGGVMEDNSFGTHEFFELCRQLGCKTYVNGNVGSGSVREMSEWVEYMTFNGTSPMADLRAENGQKEAWTVDYFGVGNENWGCGGNMLPEYYGHLYRQYQTYIRQYNGDKPIRKIACGPNTEDYNWTETLLKTCFEQAPEQAHGFMDLLSLHYYTVPGTWEDKGDAVEFDEKDWYVTLNKTIKMDELIRRHGEIMDKYDPEKKIGIAVDEWGTWYNVSKGTNPGFLFQQNTVRDAILAGINFDIFNKHCDRVKLACIAQLANVLQSVILTEGSEMVLTPTYYVFHMYRHHQGANLLESTLTGVEEIGVEEGRVPEISQSVSIKDGIITATLSNLSTDTAKEVKLSLEAKSAYEIVEARVLLGETIQSHNTFENPNAVSEEGFKDYSISGNEITLTIPAHSVVMIRIK